MADDKKKNIAPIDATFDEVVGALTPRVTGKELDMKSKEIKHLPRSYAGKELDPKQGVLDLQIDRLSPKLIER